MSVLSSAVTGLNPLLADLLHPFKSCKALSCRVIAASGAFCGTEITAVSCGLKYSSSTSSGWLIER